MERVLVLGPGLGDHGDVGRLVAGGQLRGHRGGRGVARLGQRGIPAPGPSLLNGESPLERLGGERGVGDAAYGAEGGVDTGAPGTGHIVICTDLHRQSVGGEKLVGGQAPEQTEFRLMKHI